MLSNLSLNGLIHSKYFSYELIPYNEILKTIMIYLQKKLSKPLFNEVYKIFLNELKYYVSSTSKYSYKESAHSNNQSINKVSSFNLGKFDTQIKTAKFKKNIKPLVGLSYSNKIKDFNEISSENKTDYNTTIQDSNFLNRFSYIKSAKNKKVIAKNITLNNSNNHRSYFLNNFESAIKKNINVESSYKENLKLFKKKSGKNKISLKHNFQTISQTYNNNVNIQKNKNDSKLNNRNNNNKTIIKKKNLKKLNQKIILTTLKADKNNNGTRTNKKFTLDINRSQKDKPIGKAVFINNTIYNKFNNNYKFGLLRNNKNKVKVINIKLKTTTQNNSKNILQNKSEAQEEMLNKIKKTLDDDNLRVMLNFSYENFLSKESERESHEYSLED